MKASQTFASKAWVWRYLFRCHVYGSVIVISLYRMRACLCFTTQQRACVSREVKATSFSRFFRRDAVGCQLLISVPWECPGSRLEGRDPLLALHLNPLPSAFYPRGRLHEGSRCLAGLSAWELPLRKYKRPPTPSGVLPSWVTHLKK